MDKKQFEELLSEFKNPIERFVYYKLSSKADADDVLQEIYLTAFQKFNCLNDKTKFKTWLLKIAQNKCNDYYRAHAKRQEIEFADESVSSVQTNCRYGRTVSDAVHETLEKLSETDKLILRLFYIENKPQAQIAKQLAIPIGTVKSRLFKAKQSFREKYPLEYYSPKTKGKIVMKKLPETLPEYKITKSPDEPFNVKWEELMGWFLVPKLGEKIRWAMYDFPERKKTECYELEVVGCASVHGIDGVEIVAKEHRGGEHEGHEDSRNLARTFIANLTDTHCRFLAESHYEGDIKKIFTFLDADEFLPNWGFGEDNCGNEVNIAPKGFIDRDGNIVTTKSEPFLLDVVGRYLVTIGGNEYDCICVMDVDCYNSGVASEQYLDKNGKTILWRRFNRDNWAFSRYNQLWSEKLPGNEKLNINGETYVHWYDCITDYIL